MGLFSDGFQNVAARMGYGQARDKASASTHVFVPLTRQEIEATYRSNALARKIVDLPAEDAGREWREWQADPKQITEIEAEEKRLGLQGKMILAKKAARLVGGAAIYMHLPGDSALPVNLRAIRKGGLQHLTVLDRDDLLEGEIETDPREPGYGKPRKYTLRTQAATDVTIHPSRLVIVAGETMPGRSTMAVGSAWGDSTLQSVRDTILRLNGTEASIAALVFEAKVDVLRIKDLAQNLATGGQAHEDALIRRMNLAAGIKGVNGMLLIDGEDEYSQKSASFGTLPEILDRQMQLVAAAAQMPMTLLFGKSPAGLNATGDADLRNHYDAVKVVQTLELDAAMDVLNEALIRSALGNRPDEIHHNWRPLWQPTAKERAEVAKIQTEAMKIALEMDALSVEAAGSALVNALIEGGAFPGIEAAADEFPRADDGDDDLMGDPDADDSDEVLPT